MSSTLRNRWNHGRDRHRGKATPRRRFAVGMEALEDRQLLAGLVVKLALPSPIIEGQAIAAVQIATFTDLFAPPGGDPVGNYSATVVWGDGTTTTTPNPGLSIVADPVVPGQFDVIATHTYVEESGKNPLKFKLTVNDSDGNNGVVNKNVTVADAGLTLAPVAVAPVEGQPFSGAVATFTDANPLGTTSDFAATIDWGDGNSSPGVVTQDPVTKVFTITAGNTYAEETPVIQPDTVTVTLTDVGGAAPLPLTQSVAVSDAALTAGPSQSVNAVEGGQGTFTVATFTDADPLAKVAFYSGTIDWGDGSNPSAATILSAGGGVFNVQGTHTYADENAIPYTVNVTINDDGGATTSATATVTVGDAQLTPTGINLAAIEGQTLPGTTPVATFKDANLTAPVTDFTATIDFGDGVNTAVPGAITPLGNGVFSVSAGTTYLDEGSYNITVTITDIGGATTQALSTATITDAGLTGLGTVLTGIEGVALNNVVVATFSDLNTGATPADFTTGGGSVTIVWGDGNIQRTSDPINPVQVVSAGGGSFAVLGSNTYKQAQGYPITISIVDDGGQRTTATSAATITPAPVTPGPSVNVSAVEGVAFSDPIGTFTSANPFAVASSFFATIQWGDGTSTNAKIAAITPGSNTFVVTDASGGHLYPEESPTGQTYPINVIVHGTGGQAITLSATAAVADAPLTPSAIQPVLQPTGSPPFLEGKTFSGVVASFTDANANAPLGDFSATIVWGDGHNSAGSVAFDAVNKVFTVSGANTYFDEGNFALAIVVKDRGGRQTAPIPNQIIVNDAPIQAVANAISTIAGTAFNGPVATLTDTYVNAPLSDFAATIDWGDGSSSSGVVTQPGGVGAPFVILGTHVYANPGASLAFNVTITDKGGQATTVGSTAKVLRTLQGGLNPSSDSGVSNSDNITNVNQPLYSGTSEPNAAIALLVNGVAVNHGFADASGRWNLTTNVLADGLYSISALTFNPTTVLQTIPLGTLIVDTTPPTVARVVFNPGARQLQIILQDNLSGFYPSSLSNTANYQFGLVARSGAVQRFTPKSLSLSPGAPGSGQVVVTLSYDFPRGVRPGAYVVTIVTNSIQDKAGNRLVETNLVTFPQTTNSPNPNYVAEIDVSRGGSASSPHLFIPLAERRAANRFSQGVRRRLKFTPR